MTRRRAEKRLDFEALRLGIERRDPDVALGFYAEDAELSIFNAESPSVPPFELRGKAEIAKHLLVVFGQGASHRVEGEVVGGDLVTFRERCEYPDGSRFVVETTLELREGEIARQTDVVAKDARPAEETGRGPPARQTGRKAGPEAYTTPLYRTLRHEQAFEKEEPR